MSRIKPLSLNAQTLSSIPALGYGVGTAWFRSGGDARKEEALYRGVEQALDAGFLHIDDAEMYSNDMVTGRCINAWLQKSQTDRKELFITSKVMSVDEGIRSVCEASLASMGLTYFDLYLIHAPFNSDGSSFKTPLSDLWQQMEELVELKLVRNIGVSNFRMCDLEQIYSSAKIKPCCNQIEGHPYLQQPTLLDYCQKRGILVTAYGPLTSLTKAQGGPIDIIVERLGAKYQKTAAQILLRWCIQTGRGAITTTSRVTRLAEYLGVFDEEFELTTDEVGEISSAGKLKQQRFFWMATKGRFLSDPSLEPDSKEL